MAALRDPLSDLQAARVKQLMQAMYQLHGNDMLVDHLAERRRDEARRIGHRAVSSRRPTRRR